MTTIITEGVSIVYLKLLPFIIFITGNMSCMEIEKKLHRGVWEILFPNNTDFSILVTLGWAPYIKS